MSKRKQQYDIEKDREYSGVEHMHVDPKARARFKAKAYEPRGLPRYDTIGYMKAKGHNTKGVMESGGREGTE